MLRIGSWWWNRCEYYYSGGGRSLTGIVWLLGRDVLVDLAGEICEG